MSPWLSPWMATVWITVEYFGSSWSVDILLQFWFWNAFRFCFRWCVRGCLATTCVEVLEFLVRPSWNKWGSVILLFFYLFFYFYFVVLFFISLAAHVYVASSVTFVGRANATRTRLMVLRLANRVRVNLTRSIGSWNAVYRFWYATSITDCHKFDWSRAYGRTLWHFVGFSYRAVVWTCNCLDRVPSSALLIPC